MYEVKITSYDRSLVEAYYSSTWFRNSHVVIEGSQSWEEVINWKATYWKMLPFAHRLNFRYADKETSQEPVLDFVKSKAQLKAEYEEFLKMTESWYQPPTFSAENRW